MPSASPGASSRCRGGVQGEPGVAADGAAAAGAGGSHRRGLAADGERAAGAVLQADEVGPQAAGARDRRLDAAGLRDRAATEGGGIAMSLWRQLTRGLRVLTDRSAAD